MADGFLPENTRSKIILPLERAFLAFTYRRIVAATRRGCEKVFTKSRTTKWKCVMVRRSRLDGVADVPSRFDEARFLRILGLSPATVDPVGIITAAQIRLRRLRRLGEQGLGAPHGRRIVHARRRIQLITEARDVLLARHDRGIVADGMVGSRRPE